MTKLQALPAPTARISARLRKAIELRVRKGMKINDACAEAGMTPSAWFKAMKRPAVQDYLQKVQEDYVKEAETLKSTLRTRAYEVARELMENAKSETVRARMVEFLLSDGKAPTVSVNVDARPFNGGYEFVPKGHRLVEIIPPDAPEGAAEPAEDGASD